MKVPLALIAIGIFAADHAHKAWSVAHLRYYEVRPLLGSWLGLTRHLNSGLAGQKFSAIVPGESELYTRYLPTAALALFVCVFLLARRFGRNVVESAGMALIVGGGTSNLWDHWHGYYVLDTLQIFNGVILVPCNIADVGIVSGALLLTVIWARELFPRDPFGLPTLEKK